MTNCLKFVLITSLIHYNFVTGNAVAVRGSSNANGATNTNSNTSSSSGYLLFGKLINCFSEIEVNSCLHDGAVNILENAISDNSTWELNEYVSIDRDPEWERNSVSELSGRSVDEDSISTKLGDLVNSRTLHWSWNSKGGGRKKHDKHKHKHGGGMLMMGGVALVAMMTQFFLGKIAFVAGAALVIAKLALYFATMKQYFRDITVPTTHDVVYADHGHSSSPSGWQRSIYPTREDSIYEDFGNFTDNHNTHVRF